MTSTASTTSGFNDIYSLISSKNLYFKVKTYIYDGLLLLIAKSHFEPNYFALLVWFTYYPVEGAQHQKNKNWQIRHK